MSSKCPRHFLRSGVLAAALIMLFSSAARAQTPFWFRGSTNGGLGTTGNWAINAAGTTNGTTPGATDIVTFSVAASNSTPLNRWSMASANRSYGSITISNSGTNFIMRTSDGSATNSTSVNLTLLNGITNASVAGAFQLGDTDRKATLKLGNTDVNFSVANNSANSMTFQQQVGLSSATASNRTLVVSGTGTGNTVFQQGLENGGNGTSALSLSINNTGAVWIDGPSTYTGGTTLTAGTIALGSSSALGTGLLTINGGAIGSVNSARTLANNIAVGGDFGFGVTNAGFNGQTTTLNGNVDLGASTRTITMLANSANIAGVISGAGGLTVASASATRTLTLTNANTYTGPTTVNGGILRVNGTLASSSVTIGSGATLGGAGVISNATSINGIHSPGTSPGLQTFGGGLTYNSGATFIWELNANSVTARGTSFDGVNVAGGTLTINTGVTNNLVFNAIGSSVLWSDAFWDSSQSWLVFSNASSPSLGSVSVFDTVNVSLDSVGNDLATARAGSGFAWSTLGDDVYLNYTVPEPSTYAMLGLAAAAFAGYSIRRRKRAGN